MDQTSVSMPEAAALLFKQTEDLYSSVMLIRDSALHFHAEHHKDENERIAVNATIELTNGITKLIAKANRISNITFTLPPEKKNELPSDLPKANGEQDNPS